MDFFSKVLLVLHIGLFLYFLFQDLFVSYALTEIDRLEQRLIEMQESIDELKDQVAEIKRIIDSHRSR